MKATFWPKLLAIENWLFPCSLLRISHRLHSSDKVKFEFFWKKYMFNVDVYKRQQYDRTFISFPMSVKNAGLGRPLGFTPNTFLSKMLFQNWLSRITCPVNFTLLLFPIIFKSDISSFTSAKTCSLLFLSIQLVLVDHLQTHIFIASSFLFSILPRVHA